MSEIYNSDYYSHYSGDSYANAEVWEPFFRAVADRIVADFNPKVVLDAGCAWGYLVAALRDRGVEAYGLDVSAYAIEHVRDDIRPYCHAGSLTEAFPAALPDKFDLITSIEVLEHIDEELCMTAIEQICSHTDQILFSSTSEDIQDETHVNVQQPEYWMKRFAQFGFYHQVQYHAEYYLSPDAVYLKRMDDIPGIVSNYERLWRQIKKTKSTKNTKINTELYIDNNGEYTNANKFVRETTSGELYSETYKFDSQPIKKLRFDPADGMVCIVKRLEVYSDKKILKTRNINGNRINEFDFFSVTDPMFEIDLDGQQVDWIRVECEICVIENSVEISFLSMMENVTDEYFHRNQIIDEQAGQILQLQMSLNNARQANSEQNRQILLLINSNNALKYNNITQGDSIEILSQKMKSLVEERNELSASIDIIHRSTSWKLTRPIRFMSRLARHITGKSKDLDWFSNPHGMSIDFSKDTFVSKTDDPYFLFDHKIGGQWAKVTWSGHSDTPRELTFYYDQGDGFSEEKILQMGVLTSDAATRHILLRIDKPIHRYRIDPGAEIGEFVLHSLRVKPMGRLGVLFTCLRDRSSSTGKNISESLIQFIQQWMRHGRSRALHGMFSSTRVMSLGGPSIQDNDYEIWIQFNQPSAEELERQKSVSERFPLRPVISVVVPVYNTDPTMLSDMIDSVVGQTYPYWELCLADGASTKPHVREIINIYASNDSRIRYKFLEENMGISGNTNAALEMASGEFISLLDHDDMLASHALFSIVEAINKEPNADMLYSDEDKFTEAAEKNPSDRFMPHFKSAFNPELLRSNNYICHLLTIKRDLLEQIGGFRSEFDGSQDHDLILRVSEKAETIVHIPDVLYHWRSHRESVAQNMDAKTYALAAGRKAVEEHLQRIHRSGKVEVDEKYPGTYKVQYDLISHPFVSIIIPNMDHVEDLRRCLESIDHSTYDNYEVIIVENNSVKPETFAYYDTIRSDRVHILSFAGPFNFSKINNEAVKHAVGEHVVLLNNDTTCLTPDWIEQLLQYSQYDDIGAVGAKLLYPDNTVQHAGVIIGLGGIAGHAHLNRKKDDPGYMFRAVVPQAIGAVTGACLMIRKDKYLGVGGMNDDFAVAFNDIDLCLRLMKAGYRNIFTPYVQMVHYESKSRGNDMDPDKIDRFSSEVDLFEQLWDMCRFSDQFYNPNFSLRNPSIGGFSVIGERLKNKQIRTNNSDISKN